MKSRLMLFSLLSLLFSSVVVAAEHEVQMLNAGEEGSMVFEPAFLKVAVGDTVKFVATDPGHNAESVYVPEGAAAWQGGMSEDVSVKMDKEGVYIYACAPHTMMAMVGVIQVGNATNKAAADTAAEALSSRIVMNKERLVAYMGQVK